LYSFDIDLYIQKNQIDFLKNNGNILKIVQQIYHQTVNDLIGLFLLFCLIKLVVSLSRGEKTVQ